MASETIQERIELINREIEKIALESFRGKLNTEDGRNELATAYKKIESEILGSDLVQALLTNNNATGREIAEAISEGIKKAETKLKTLEENLVEADQKTFVRDLREDTNQGAKSVLKGIQDLQEGIGDGILTNEERYEDLSMKIGKSEQLILMFKNADEMKEKFGGYENLKDGLGDCLVELEKYKKIEGIRAISGDEVKEQVKEAIKIFEEVEKDPFAPDIVEKLKTMNKKFNELKDTTFMLDKVDLKGKMNITEKFIDNEDGIAGWSVDEKKEWLNDIKTKVFNPENVAKIEISDKKLESINKMLNKCKTETLKFLYSKENQEFLKLIDSENLAKCKPDASIQDLQNNIDKIMNTIRDFQDKSLKVSEKQLEGFIKEAKRIRSAYAVALGKDTSYRNKVEINGIEFEFDSDKIDFSTHEAQKNNLNLIKGLNDDNEFKKIFEEEAKKLAGKRPVNKWYQNLFDRIPIVRMFYMSPEKKYEYKLEGKREEVVKNLTQQNIEKVTNAAETIEKDKQEYHKKAVQKTFENKKEIGKEDKHSILSAIDTKKIPPKQAPKKSDGPER